MPKPDAIFNVLFSADLGKFVREGNTRGLFKDRKVVSLLTSEPDYLDPLGAEAPVGWIVTGYPWYSIDTPANKQFVAAYQAKYHDYPRLGSVVSYTAMMSLANSLKKPIPPMPTSSPPPSRACPWIRRSARSSIASRTINRRWARMSA